MSRLQKSKQIESSIIEYIRSYIDENGYSPTIREISYALDIKSTSTVSNYLDKLRQNGVISKISQKTRSISIEEHKTKSATNIPLIGKVTAGIPMLAQENVEEVFSLPIDLFSGEDLFMLTVSGDSMKNAGIENGDKIIVRKQNHAENGEIVVALVDNDNATVKRYYKKDDAVILHAENSEYTDIISSNVKIVGKVTGLIRSI